MKTVKDIIGVGCLVVGFFLLFMLFRNRPSERIEYFTDTVYVREVVRDTILVPRTVYLTRIDTIYVASDSQQLAVILPIERKVYESDFYRAVIEGYRPELLEMAVFPQTKYITNTEIRTIRKKTKFGVGFQVGYGISGGALKPYIGVGVQYNFFSL